MAQLAHLPHQIPSSYLLTVPILKSPAGYKNRGFEAFSGQKVDFGFKSSFFEAKMGRKAPKNEFTKCGA